MLLFFWHLFHEMKRNICHNRANICRSHQEWCEISFQRLRQLEAYFFTCHWAIAKKVVLLFAMTCNHAVYFVAYQIMLYFLTAKSDGRSQDFRIYSQKILTCLWIRYVTFAKNSHYIGILHSHKEGNQKHNDRFTNTLVELDRKGGKQTI